MSIAVLTQVYDEMRRLAIAGSGVASGDFRLRKLIAPLEKSGEKAPVFAKVAQAATVLVDSNEKTASVALLDLATLVNAVLYTQGETGLAGEFQNIETVDLGARQTQASARLLKPLLEALSTTGSGRLEIIRDAYDQGAFTDLRLVKAALKALDDPYPEIGELMAAKVLPLYGKSILSELRRQYDPKGKSGHIHRLRLLHRSDPAGTRDLVQQTLDDGSKELKVVAISCLGDTPEDLAYLLQQSKAKAKDVRFAALNALSKLTAQDAVDAVMKAAAGADLMSITTGVRDASSPAIREWAIDEASKDLAALLKTSDKKQRGVHIGRLMVWGRCLDATRDPAAEKLLLKLFSERDALAKMSGEPSGADLNESVAYHMSVGTPKMQTALVDARDALSGPAFVFAFDAGRRSLPPAKVFEKFSAYLRAKPDKKTKVTPKDFDQVTAIRRALLSDDPGRSWAWGSEPREPRETPPPLDPRWLDVAVEESDLQLLTRLARPNHAALNQWLIKKFSPKTSLTSGVDYEILRTLVAVQHSEATKCVLQTLEAAATKADSSYAFWLERLIPSLPQSAVEPLQALLPTLPDKLAKSVLEAVLILKNRDD